jgi:hypothetical protein
VVTVKAYGRLAIAGALAASVAGCAGGTAASRSSVVALAPTLALPCVDPNPPVPAPVQPAIPGSDKAGGMASAWTLDGGQLTLAPSGGALPTIRREQALCTLLSANEANGFDVLEADTGFSLVLAKVTVAEQLVASPQDEPLEDDTDSPPPLTPFHSRLAWIGVVDAPLKSSCGSDGFASASPSPELVPYQLLILDARTGLDGMVYSTRSYSPCAGSPATGPSVAALMMNVSVPWHLVSRDPGGMFATISVADTTCDGYGMGENTSAAGLVEIDVVRPIAICGSPKDVEQTLRGPTVSDRLPTTLTHSALGYRDALPSSRPPSSVSPAALLCEESARANGVVAATYPTTVGQLVASRAGHPTHSLLTDDARRFPGTTSAAWCEVKTASGYSIYAAGPNGIRLSNDIVTSSTFTDLANGPPALP